MKKLDVKHYTQTQRNDCMATCLKMVFDFHGIDEDYTTIKESFSFYSMGLSMPQIGSYAINKGMNAEIEMLNPFIFNIQDIGKSQEKIREKILQATVKNEDFKNIRDYFLNFMDLGGKVTAKIPTKKSIIDEIDLGNPVIILATTNLLHGHKAGYNFHGNVVYGYDDENFFVHDPEQSNFDGGSHIINQDALMYAIYVMGHADFDNASILKIRP